MQSEVKHIDYQNVRRLRQGDLFAFDSLFNKYAQRLFNFSNKYLKSTQEAEEVVQEVFLLIWEKRKGLKPESSFNAYIFTIAYNIIKKHFIRKAREHAYVDEQLYIFLSDGNNLDKTIDYKFLLEKVEKIIDGLPARRREVFLKRKYHGLSIKEVADELKISPNTVENHFSAAQKQILRELKDEKLAGILFFALFISV